MKSIAIIGVLALAGGTSADIAFDNFGQGNTYNGGTGWTISGQNSVLNADYDQGEQFTALADGIINFIDIAIGHVTGTNNFFVDLHEDAGGQPGNIISSWTGGPMQTFGATSDQPINIVNNDPNANLVAGTKYWIIASVPDDTWAAFNWNSIGDVGPHAFREANGGWQVGDNTRGAFRIDVTRIPGPGALALLALGGIGAARRRR
jgi:hypothetical protein